MLEKISKSERKGEAEDISLKTKQKESEIEIHRIEDTLRAEILKLATDKRTAENSNEELCRQLTQLHSRQDATEIQLDAIQNIINDVTDTKTKFEAEQTAVAEEFEAISTKLSVLNETQEARIEMTSPMYEAAQPKSVESVVAPYLELLTARLSEAVEKSITKATSTNSIPDPGQDDTQPIPVLNSKATPTIPIPDPDRNDPQRISVLNSKKDTTQWNRQIEGMVKETNNKKDKKQAKKKNRAGNSETEIVKTAEPNQQLIPNDWGKDLCNLNPMCEEPARPRSASLKQDKQYKASPKPGMAQIHKAQEKPAPENLSQQTSNPYSGKKKCILVHDPFMKNFEPGLFSSWFDISAIKYSSIDDLQKKGSLLRKVKELEPAAIAVHLGFGDIWKGIDPEEIVNCYRKLIWDLVDNCDAKICISDIIPVPGLVTHDAKIKEVNEHLRGFITHVRKIRPDLRQRIFTSNNSKLGQHMGTEMSATSNKQIPKLTERGQKLMWLILRDGISGVLGLAQPRQSNRNPSKIPRTRLDNE